MNRLARGRLISVLIMTAALMAPACEEDVCPVCPVCPSCTLTTLLDIGPIFDGCVLDGVAPAMKDGLGDWVLEGSMLIVKNNTSPVRDHNIEARGIIEFDITPITGEIDTAALVLTLDHWENMPFGENLVLCNYIGNGTFHMFDFNLGSQSPVDTVRYNGEWTITFDVTEALRSHSAAGDTCAGFNIRLDPPTACETCQPAIIFRSTHAGPPPYLAVTQTVIVDPE